MWKCCNHFVSQGCFITFSWSDAPLGIFPAGDIPAISLDVAELADCESATVEGVVLPVTGLCIGTVGAATGLGTTGGATGVAENGNLYKIYIYI